ncbi:Hpt domain-containing protein [Roseateles chitosanitabidus]|uniref:Hpt domain-containing protein n=1 Tax=Roseateles chitosanitabidus TaxID=65048 RepID=UPI001470E2A6|nr:Hpt domain-containing protein [Roseateles chitosanitabidus]MBO9688439.1 Hpt domain-containing protein [Roseateles chitosanitabidus]
MSPHHVTTMPSLPQPEPAVLDEQALARLRELDPDGVNQLLHRVVAAFLKSLDQQELVLAQGLEAPRDLNGLRHVAHTLKSAAASLGANALSQRCAEIEALARAGREDGLAALIEAVLGDISSARLAMRQLVGESR